MNEEETKIFVKKFVSKKCRFLITSRKSLGELEEKIEIGRLQDFEAKLMVDNFMSIFNIKHLLDQISNEDLGNHLNKLDNSPLHIKWFLNQVKNNNNVYELIAAGKKSDVVKFTFKNTLNDLSENAKDILDILLVQQKPISILFIKLVTGISNSPFLEIGAFFDQFIV